MILRYAHLSRHPAAFRRMTGLRVPEFDALVADLLPGYAAAEQARLQRPTRRRRGPSLRAAPGRPTAADRHLVADLSHPRGARVSLRRQRHDRVARPRPLAAAAGGGARHHALPDPGQRHRRHLDALLADTTGLAVIVDTFAQRVQRPRDRTAADRRYSGKKQQHTRKSQPTINEITGEVVDVAASVPGPTADRTLVE